MKSSRFKYTLLVLFFLLSNSLIGQSKKKTNQNIKIKDTTYVKVKDSSYVSLDANFISDAVFMGRKDSISSPYLYPSITYHNKSGFYATSSLSYLTKSNEGRIDLFLITTGFDFSINKLDGDISVTKYFFNDDSYNVISEVEGDITALFKYDFDFINLALGANTYFNTNSSSDFFLSSEISHDFISKDEKFQISPTAGMSLGSQNFYEQYFIKKRTGSGQGNSNTSQSIELKESKEFNLMALEFSLPIWYVEEPFTVSLLPVFVIPKSPSTITIDGVSYEENLENTFYWMIGVSYKLK